MWCGPREMEWKKTRFPGCEVKGLLFDKETGVVTALMRFAPGAVLPDHEHVKIEQTYVLEGRLVDKEGPAKGLSVGPGEFVWREAGSRHVACTPEGGLMLAMFQVPNKFYESDGRVTDISGANGTRSGRTYSRIEAVIVLQCRARFRTWRGPGSRTCCEKSSERHHNRHS